jgi:hypothetical protein
VSIHRDKSFGRLTIIRSILFTRDHGLRVEQRPVGTSLNITEDTGLQIDVETAERIFLNLSPKRRWKIHLLVEDGEPSLVRPSALKNPVS